METKSPVNKHRAIFVFYYLCILLSSASGKKNRYSRKSFPDGFIFGAGSSAYQYEGAAREEGKGLSIFDTFTKNHPDAIVDGSNGDVADDFYHRYKGDVKLMKEMGLDSFRFSISWTRILPKGKVCHGINPLGIKFYNNLIDELLANGIKPLATLFHWDIPQALEDEYGGPLSPKLVDDFREFADICFKEFGDRVKHWGTLNEPNMFIQLGYVTGTLAPGRCSTYIGNCSAGDSATEPYLVAHHLLLSHASAVHLYRRKYQKSQMGIIGIIVQTNMFLPYNQTRANRMATLRACDFSFGWILDPVVYGNYPKTMRSILGKRLPKFTNKQSQLLKQSYDYIGLNYYTTSYALDAPTSFGHNLSYTTDSKSTSTAFKNGVPIGQPTFLNWLYIYPKGIRDLLLYVKNRYNNPPVMITENGMADGNNGSLFSFPTALNDQTRVEYHQDHLIYLLKSITDGVNVKGYYAWTFLDDFEWSSGYTIRFGINFVDFQNGLKRYPKRSFYWFKNFLRNKY